MSSDQIPSEALSALPSPHLGLDCLFSPRRCRGTFWERAHHRGRRAPRVPGGFRVPRGHEPHGGRPCSEGRAGSSGTRAREGASGIWASHLLLPSYRHTPWFVLLWVKLSLPPGPWPNEARRLWTLGKGADSPQRLLRGADGTPWRSQAENRVRRDPGASGGSERP